MASLAASSNLLDEISSHPDVLVKERMYASQCTTFAIGGPLQALVEPQSEAGLVHTLAVVGRHGEPFRVLGAGSNVLISDAGLEGVTIRLGRGLRFVQALGNGLFEVGGAMSLMSLSRELSAAGYSGLEFAGGIPASLGGAVRMNAGAHGSEIASCIDTVTLLLPDQSVVQLKPAELSFSYRFTALPPGAVVLRACLKLAASSPARCAQLRQEYLAERKKHQPLAAPSAGSVFKNPSRESSAGYLLESAGMKGAAVGGARVSDLHANWIINAQRRASAADITELIRLCQDAVRRKFAVELQPEVISWI